jgi:hypothetical protein
MKLVSLASEHMHFGVCVDNNSDSGTNQLQIDQSSGKCCDVYVWGSNSSHQLAEMSPEKIFIPQLANTFSNVQQVGFAYLYQEINFEKLCLDL